MTQNHRCFADRHEQAGLIRRRSLFGLERSKCPPLNLGLRDGGSGEFSKTGRPRHDTSKNRNGVRSGCTCRPCTLPLRPEVLHWQPELRWVVLTPRALLRRLVQLTQLLGIPSETGCLVWCSHSSEQRRV